MKSSSRLKIVWFVLALIVFVSPAFPQVHVRGYYRSDGTYVKPHYRSYPDDNPYNNWSFPGNVNPYTGEVAKGDPNTYLYHYYNRRSSSSFSNSYFYNQYRSSLNSDTDIILKIYKKSYNLSSSLYDSTTLKYIRKLLDTE
ncbi:MAG: hypothetical protein ABIM31_00350 [candidate division WOR-3 bacterium]